MMKRNIWTGLAVLCLLGSCNYESFDERCAREAREYTEKECPRRIDPYTVMDSLTFDASLHELAYYYTLERELDDKELLSDDVLDDFETSLRKALATSVEMKAYKEHGVNFRYTYMSQTTGEVLATVTLTPDKYNN